MEGQTRYRYQKYSFEEILLIRIKLLGKVIKSKITRYSLKHWYFFYFDDYFDCL